MLENLAAEPEVKELFDEASIAEQARLLIVQQSMSNELADLLHA